MIISYPFFPLSNKGYGVCVPIFINARGQGGVLGKRYFPCAPASVRFQVKGVMSPRACASIKNKQKPDSQG